ncbi:MAG: alpha/beta hydrolase [Candidatus Thiodiazotropha sp.]
MTHEHSNLHHLQLPEGRQLAYAIYGDPQGTPVIYCHGFPGSRLEARLFEAAALHHHLRVIAPDRNGLGASDPLPGRRLLDWPSDVAALADGLGIDRFHLIGVSGGGPYALACAHRLADRLNGVTLVCPLGPLDRGDNLWAMRWPAILNFSSIRTLPGFTHGLYRHWVVPFVKHHPQTIYNLMLSMVPPPDHQVLSRPQVRETIVASLNESVRGGAEGVLQEMAIYAAPWGFEPEAIDMPIALWHGTADDTVPVKQGRELAQRLPDCSARYIEGEGHFSLPVDHMDEIVEALLRGRNEVTRPDTHIAQGRNRR